MVQQKKHFENCYRLVCGRTLVTVFNSGYERCRFSCCKYIICQKLRKRNSGQRLGRYSEIKSSPTMICNDNVTSRTFYSGRHYVPYICTRSVQTVSVSSRVWLRSGGNSMLVFALCLTIHFNYILTGQANRVYIDKQI